MDQEAEWTQLDLFPEISGFQGEWFDLPYEWSDFVRWVHASCMDSQQGNHTRLGFPGPSTLRFPVV